MYFTKLTVYERRRLTAYDRVSVLDATGSRYPWCHVSSATLVLSSRWRCACDADAEGRLRRAVLCCHRVHV